MGASKVNFSTAPCSFGLKSNHHTFTGIDIKHPNNDTPGVGTYNVKVDYLYPDPTAVHWSVSPLKPSPPTETFV